MKNIKKILLITLTALLLLSGCSKSNDVDPALPEKFSAYLDQLMTESLDSKDFSINLMFIDPQKYGITPENYELGFSTLEDYKKGDADVKKVISNLQHYDDKTLTEQEKIDKYALLAYFNERVDTSQFYDYIEGGTIGYSRAFSANIPSYLEMFTFREEQDFERYFSLIETLPGFMQQYADLEKERQGRGTGYSQSELDEIIKASRTSSAAAKTSDYFLIRAFNEKIDAVTFIDAQTKETFKARNTTLINGKLAETYDVLVDSLSKLNGGEATGVANKPGGKEYYQYEFRKNTGSSLSIDDVSDLLEKRYSEVMMELISILSTKEGLNYENDYRAAADTGYSNFKSAEELMEFLASAIDADFPKTGAINFGFRTVDPSLKDTSSPAFYFTPQVDYNSSESQYIYINGDFNNKIFPTYAHEGLPGHMYQFNYFLTLDMHPVRYLYTSSANAEGWANYTERYSLKYITSESYGRFYYLYEELFQILHAQMDIGVSYEGWSLSELFDFLKASGMIASTAKESDLAETYLYFVHNPAVYPTYYVSSIYIENLKNDAKKAWGKDYTDFKFHEAFLKSGSTTFDEIRKNMGLGD